jgi:nickel/cobalt transporter (NicO) family protein
MRKTVQAQFALSAIIATFVVILIVLASSHSAWAQMGPLGGPRPPVVGGIGGWLIAKQAIFYRALAGTIRSAKTDGSALWALLGISFAYGIFHAAGPGHGKAVISSYLFANEETWRRGVTLSFASALMQSLTAVAIVAIAAVLLGATAKLMGDTVRVIEIVSYGLIAALGARLTWVKGRGLLKAVRALRQEDEPAATVEPHGHAHCHHDHDEHGDDPDHAHAACSAEHGHHGHGHDHHHDHDHEEELNALPWGHAHSPEPDQLAGPGGWHRGVSAVVSVGLRPCSGAIIVLVFALAQGMFWAGVASTFVMGIGTAITVGAIATMAVAAKAVAKRFARDRAGYGSVFMRAAEVAAAVVVLAFGLLLLNGYMVSERIVGF